jgi:hypothetical protein
LTSCGPGHPRAPHPLPRCPGSPLPPGHPRHLTGRTLLDLSGTRLPDDGPRRAVREAQARKRVTVAQLVEVLARLPCRRGSRRLARLVATGPAPTRSELEDAALDLLLRGGFAHPDVNVALVLAGRRIVPDFRWPGAAPHRGGRRRGLARQPAGACG